MDVQTTTVSGGSTSSTRRRVSAVVAAAAVALLSAGCGAGDNKAAENTPQDEKHILAGPTTNIRVEIPAGWHQVINSSNPITPEIVTPLSCMGADEVTCATGVLRLATLTAPTAEAAAQTVAQAVSTAQGVRAGPTISQGPGKIGKHDGYRHRFTFFNADNTELTAEVAAAQSGLPDADPQGNREFSVVLAWVSKKPGAPTPDIIDKVLDSALIASPS
ncbi:MAG: hypothetical protein M3Z25_07345 [Actinomycetota bacterium]|nr:hypothetical protein [Actinomycetota bacterium]